MPKAQAIRLLVRESDSSLWWKREAVPSLPRVRLRPTLTLGFLKWAIPAFVGEGSHGIICS